MNTPVATPKVKAALAEVIRRKDAIQDLVSKRQQFEQQVTVVDQGRTGSGKIWPNWTGPRIFTTAT